MNQQEAIIQLEVMATNMLGGIQAGNKLAEKQYDALDLAISALNKQIPMKPFRHSQDTSDWDCPYCAYEFLTDEKFCPNCGQAIDWTERG